MHKKFKTRRRRGKKLKEFDAQTSYDVFSSPGYKLRSDVR